MESLLEGEDQSLLRPVVNQDIPFCISSDVVNQLDTLGAVGGGVTPIDFECNPKGARGSLMEVIWQLPERCGRLHRFEVEFEQVQDSSVGQGSGSVDQGDLVYNQKEPQFYEVPGTQLSAFVDHLCPNYTYHFRIRSANDAGFGMWSDPIVGKCAGFPFTLEYTKKIHRITIPISGYYRITAKGAKAADGLVYKGGKGAIMSASFSLKCGDVLIMLVGGMSSRHHYHSGGGGGTFVAVNDISQDSLLIAAGGGGGTRGADSHDCDGTDANIYEDGLDGLTANGARGGRAGGKGDDAIDDTNPTGPTWGNGGAGFMEDSSTAFSFVAGGHGGQNGGFGGGGAVGLFGGGGGGGYSGGGGGRGGGGGGSYVKSTGCDVSRDVGNEGHGSICIERVEPPYPNSNTFLNRVPSSTDSSNSSHVNRLESQTSTSSIGTNKQPNTMASSTSVSTNISTIPEDNLYQSPANTAQVMDRSDNLSPVMFSIDHLNGNEDPDVELIPRSVPSHVGGGPVQPAAHMPEGRLEGGYSQYTMESAVAGPHKVVEVVNIVPSIPLGSGAPMEQTPNYQPNHPAPANVSDLRSTSSSNVQGLINVYESHQTASSELEGPGGQTHGHPHQSIFVNSPNPPPPVTSSGDSSTSQWVSQQQFEQDQNLYSAYLDTLRQQQSTLVAQPNSAVPQPSQQTVSPPVTQMQQLSTTTTQAGPLTQPPSIPYTVVPQPGTKQNISPPNTQQHQQQYPPVPQTGTVQTVPIQYQQQQQQQQQQTRYVIPQGRQNVSPPLTQVQPNPPPPHMPSQPSLLGQPGEVKPTSVPGQ